MPRRPKTARLRVPGADPPFTLGAHGPQGAIVVWRLASGCEEGVHRSVGIRYPGAQEPPKSGSELPKSHPKTALPKTHPDLTKSCPGSQSEAILGCLKAILDPFVTYFG